MICNQSVTSNAIEEHCAHVHPASYFPYSWKIYISFLVWDCMREDACVDLLSQNGQICWIPRFCGLTSFCCFTPVSGSTVFFVLLTCCWLTTFLGLLPSCCLTTFFFLRLYNYYLFNWLLINLLICLMDKMKHLNLFINHSSPAHWKC